MNENEQKWQEKLKAEQAILEEELRGIAHKNPLNPKDWQAIPGETGEVDFREDVAERLEEFEDREATVLPLEKRLELVNQALERLEKGTYGKCLVCAQDIEVERLAANPAATTCKQHLN